LPKIRAVVSFAQIAQTVVILLAAAGVYGFVLTAKDGETRRACTALCALRPDYAARNRLAPEFELPDINGKNVRLSDFRGKAVMLHFWTKTCRPCLEELPDIATLAKALRPHPQIVLVTITTDENAADARATLESVLGQGETNPFIVLIDPDGDKVVAGKYGTKLFPETWFIDPNGVIRARFDGPRDWEGALTLDLAHALSAPIPCEVTYSAGRATGEFAGLCGEVAPGS
jgi:peroxiredoxin